MDLETYLEQELVHFGLMDKAKEILANLGGNAAVSYIKASYHLLSKVYHPDLNSENPTRAGSEMKRLNHISQIIQKMSDEQLIVFLKARMEISGDSRVKILLVEDDPLLLELFQRVLEIEGYYVQTATDGEEGLKIFKQFPADLINTDVVMPSMSGLEMVQRIRLVRPDVKVIFTTGYISIDGIGRMIQQEVDTHGYRILTKPFKISLLLETVKDYLETSQRKDFVRGIGSVCVATS